MCEIAPQEKFETFILQSNNFIVTVLMQYTKFLLLNMIYFRYNTEFALSHSQGKVIKSLKGLELLHVFIYCSQISS